MQGNSGKRVERLLAVLTLQKIRGVGLRRIRQWLFESSWAREDPFWWVDAPEVRISAGEKERARQEAQSVMELLDKYSLGYAFVDEELYPSWLAQCDDAPPVLYFRGNLHILNQYPVLAIVGTRKPDAWAVAWETAFLEKLKEYHPCIVSGLAYGCDAVAHREALRWNLPTCAILAHGLDRVYPEAHRGLAEEIVEAGGVLVSEYPPGTGIHPGQFPARNRLIAGCSSAVLIVQSGIPGGALLTARFAWEYGRKVLVVPGRPQDERSRGCIRLLQEGIAYPVLQAEDVIQHLGWQKGEKCPGDSETPTRMFVGNPLEEKILRILRQAQDPVSLDALALRLEDVDMGDLLELLTEMEFEGKIRSLPGQRYLPVG